MSGLKLIDRVNANYYYAGPAGVGIGDTGGFEAHVCVSHRGNTSGAGFSDGGLLACGDGTDGWALSMDWNAGRGVATFNAYVGDTGGATVALASEEQVGCFGTMMLLSLYVAADGTLGLYLNGTLLAADTLAGNYAPVAGASIELGAITYGFTPRSDISFMGAAFSSGVNSDTTANQFAAVRALAVRNTNRLFSALTWNNLVALVGPLEYEFAWDSQSLMDSGPRTTTAADRQIPATTWIPRSGTSDLTAQIVGTPDFNMITYNNVEWLQPTVAIPAA